MRTGWRIALLTLMFCLIAASASAMDIPIGPLTFPDTAFRDYVQRSLDTDKDGKLSEKEQSITYMNVSNMRIGNLNGIQYFPKLTILYCSSNNLSALNLSMNTALTRLYCDRNQLKSLTLSTNTHLTELKCNDNQLTSLSVGNPTGLTSLYCQNNASLGMTNFSGFTGLRNLTIGGYNMGSVTLGSLSQLTMLNADRSGLSSIDLSGCSALKDLSLASNRLTSIDLSRNRSLEKVNLTYNQLTAINLSGCGNLVFAYLNNNKLASCDVSGCARLEELRVESNQLHALDVSHNAALKKLSLSSNALSTIDLTRNAQLENLQIASMTSLSSLNLKGNPNLRLLYCYWTNVSSLDLSGNKQLTYLWLHGNRLDHLDLSGLNGNPADFRAGDNTRTVATETGILDLTTLNGFDPKKATGWSGGTVKGNILTFEAETVTYSYDCGKGQKLTFSLKNTVKVTGKPSTDEKTGEGDRAGEIVARLIRADMTDKQKAKGLHDWIVTNAHYSLKYNTASGIFDHGEGLCEAYARAYKELLDQAGLENRLVTGTAGVEGETPGSHMWNQVKIDKIWMHVDCTWDDPVNPDGTFQSEGKSGRETHTYFLLTDHAINQDHFWEGHETAVGSRKQSEEKEEKQEEDGQAADEAKNEEEDEAKDAEIVASGGKYKLDGKKKTATLIAPENKNAKELVIPAKIEYESETYKVTAVAAKACKGMEKLAEVTIGSNVSSIGSEAFSGCGKLKHITIKGVKLESVGKNAFKGINKKAKVKCSKDKAKEYQKMVNGK